MKILIFLFPLYFCVGAEKPTENPKCNDIQIKKCEKRRGFRCHGIWKPIYKRDVLRKWKAKFECRKQVFYILFSEKIGPLQCENGRRCGNCNAYGTEYVYSGSA